MEYLKNTILNPTVAMIDNIEKIFPDRSGSLNIPMYNIVTLQKIKRVINSLRGSVISYMTVSNNTCLEKIAFELYGNANYWDILLLLNTRNPLFQMPYDFDVLSDAADKNVSEYERKVYKKKLPAKIQETFRKTSLEKLTDENERFRVLKYIQPARIFDFLQILYENKLIKN